jgi:hypothetical protein
MIRPAIVRFGDDDRCNRPANFRAVAGKRQVELPDAAAACGEAHAAKDFLGR